MHGTSDISRTLQQIVLVIFGLAQMTYFSLFFVHKERNDGRSASDNLF